MIRRGHAALVALAALLAGAGARAASGAEPPLAVDKGKIQLVYLHDAIVQERQEARPFHREFGYYELDLILQTFRARGFEVRSEIRPIDATFGASADRTVTQVRALLAAGVPPERIVVVGAGAGGDLALAAAARLGDPKVRYALLGVCLGEQARALLKREGHAPRGQMLVLHEASDEDTSECEPWRDDPLAYPGLLGRALVIATGLRQGFVYRPLREWVEPVVGWALGPGGR